MSMSFTQVCSCCGKDKELIPANYYRSKEAVNGFHHECRECYVPKWIERNKEVDWSDPFPAWVTAFAQSRVLTFSKDPEKIAAAAERREELKNGVKKCSCCGEVKPLTDFYVHKKTIDKRTSWCKSCMSKQSKQQRDAKKQESVVKELNDDRSTT